MIDPEHDRSIKRQARVLEISRSSAYYVPRPVSDSDLWLMLKIDELHLNYPFASSRMLRDLLRQQGLRVGRRHVRTLMRKMAIEAIYRRPNTSKPAPGDRIYPYLMRGLAITRPNQVWAMDITYIPMARGFVYLAAVVDWLSRRVLAWRLSITMDVSFCIEALDEALSRHEKPEIFNTDQGSQAGVPADRSSSVGWSSPASLHRAAQARRHRHQHGRPGPLARQRLRRTHLEIHPIRGGLSAHLRLGHRGKKLDWQIHRVL